MIYNISTDTLDAIDYPCASCDHSQDNKQGFLGLNFDNNQRITLEGSFMIGYNKKEIDTPLANHAKKLSGSKIKRIEYAEFPDRDLSVVTIIYRRLPLINKELNLWFFTSHDDFEITLDDEVVDLKQLPEGNSPNIRRHK